MNRADAMSEIGNVRWKKKREPLLPLLFYVLPSIYRIFIMMVQLF